MLPDKTEKDLVIAPHLSAPFPHSLFSFTMRLFHDQHRYIGMLRDIMAHAASVNELAKAAQVRAAHYDKIALMFFGVFQNSVRRFPPRIDDHMRIRQAAHAKRSMPLFSAAKSIPFCRAFSEDSDPS
jgi:hypothetical protein